jgi:hypothetical protein
MNIDILNDLSITFSGCLHAYISYVDDSCDVCLVLLTVNPEHFQILADFKQTISEV